MKKKRQPSDSTSIRADEIFCNALGIENPDERNQFVHNACAGDDAVRQHVDQLLSLQGKAEELFQAGSPSLITAADIVNTLGDIPEFFENMKSTYPDDEEIGKQVGNYKLLQKIGEGGVGNVYLAEQTKPVRRQVALKIIKLGMDTRSVIARFEAERQALAMMEHPNIASVLNAGETDTGRPYFVMDLVHGEHITTFCDGNGLNIRQRLRLFLQVCHAIQHAHQKGIIHRDIKPSNVLITLHDNVPSPIVIDFGIAKATGGDVLTDKTIYTSVEPLIGTPAYMSPEQANATHTDIDTRSDIYSLGVLLYELVMGQPPFDQKELMKDGLEKMLRILREREAPPPSIKLRGLPLEDQKKIAQSHGMDLRKLCTILSSDLSWIIMKALEKDRERRYETVDAMAMDIEHHLNNEPVTTRQPSRIYRLQKLMRRNKVTFAYLTLVTVTLISGLGTSTWLFVRERAARSSEERLRSEADARANIAQAALLLSRGDTAGADHMVEKIQIPVTEPSLEAAEVFRTLGEWNVLKNQWGKAADRFSNLVYANRVDKSDLTEQVTIDLLSAAPALVAAGELDAYRQFANQTLIYYADTQDAVAAEQIIKASLLTPADSTTLQLLEPYRQVAEQSMYGKIPANDVDVYRFAWRSFSLTLLEYRKGNYSHAIEWAQKSLHSRNRNPVRLALTHILLSMSHAQLGEQDKASLELALGRKAIMKKIPDGLSNIYELGSSSTGFWHDWVIGSLLLREATAIERAEPLAD